MANSQGYKDTLNLPKTAFPMKAKLSEKEPEIISLWEEKAVFAKMIEKNRKNGGNPFVFHDGPPYANGHIHLGHVLNKVLKDTVVKFQNMMGRPTDYIPGWDCHGLPIELQVVKKLGKKRKDLSLSQFRDECRAYAEKFIDIQKEEFKRLGNFGRWENPYRTMDFAYQAAIIRELAQVAKGGYIYKDKKPIHWCISCATALAEAEIEYDNHRSSSVYVRFRTKGESWKEFFSDWQGSPIHILIWTTTPWTLPANLAICFHPDFDYVLVKSEKFGPLIVAEGLLESVFEKFGESSYSIQKQFKGKDLEGFTYESMLNGRTGKVILGDYVTLEQGTGCVHTAPGHGYDDYLNGLKNDLEIYSPVDNTGRFDDEVKNFSGLKVFDANPEIIKFLREKNYLLHEEMIEHSYPHCWRCKKPVIFRATPQWFISLEHQNLRQQALKEIDRVQWVPRWGKERIYGMIENRPDWCLSRQRIWGVPIPAVYCQDCDHAVLNPEVMENVAQKVQQKGTNCWHEENVQDFLPKNFHCSQCESKHFRKETDILDVWFDSGVSYAAVGQQFPAVTFPVDLYLEGSDQHRGWFHSSLLTSIMTRKEAPYRTVLTHGFVVDGQGRKMSKSVGNYISAQDEVTRYGAEILRLWVCAEDYRNDIRISEEIMQRLTEAYRKIRNTQRFLLGALADFNPDEHRVSFKEMTAIDRWILDRLSCLIKKVQNSFLTYEFHSIYHAIYNFCTIDLSSLYLDILKDRLYCELAADPKRRSSQTALWILAQSLCRMMAPILSVTAEEVFSHLPKSKDDDESVFLNGFPSEHQEYGDDPLHQSFNQFLDIRAEVSKALELARKDKIIGQSLDAKVIFCGSQEVLKTLKPYQDQLPFLWIVSQVEIVDQIQSTENMYQSEDLQGVKIAIQKSPFQKCARCWNYRKEVGTHQKFSDVCDRCVGVLEKINFLPQ